VPTENRIQKCLITDLYFVRLVLVFTCKKGPRANNPGFFFYVEIFFVILAKIFTEMMLEILMFFSNLGGVADKMVLFVCFIRRL